MKNGRRDKDHRRTDDAAENVAIKLMNTTHEQFSGILISPPSSEGRIKLKTGKEILRIKFRIWPGRGQPIENAYFQELIAVLKETDPDYQSWMVTINYEVEDRKPIPKTRWSWRPR